MKASKNKIISLLILTALTLAFYSNSVRTDSPELKHYSIMYLRVDSAERCSGTEFKTVFGLGDKKFVSDREEIYEQSKDSIDDDVWVKLQYDGKGTSVVKIL